MKHSTSALLTAFAFVALAARPDHARADQYGVGYIQQTNSWSKSVSATFAGSDFSLGYQMSSASGGYSWDDMPDSYTTHCDVASGQSGYYVYNCDSVSMPVTPTTSTTSECGWMQPVYYMTYGWYCVTHYTYTWDVPDSGYGNALSGSADVSATLFDQSFNLFGIQWSGTGRSYAADSLSASVSALGATIATASPSLPVSSKIINKYVTLASTSSRYRAFGIPITVNGSVGGSLYLKGALAWSAGLVGTMTPGAAVDATMSAGVGVDVVVASVEFGVTGTITVIDLQMPVGNTVKIEPRKVTTGNKATLTMQGLDGEVDLYEETCFIGICDTEYFELFDWTGLSYASRSLFNRNYWVTY